MDDDDDVENRDNDISDTVPSSISPASSLLILSMFAFLSIHLYLCVSLSLSVSLSYLNRVDPAVSL